MAAPITLPVFSCGRPSRENILSLIHIFDNGDLMTNNAILDLDYNGRHIDTGKWPGNSLTVSPVSYTHLDVYKRQPNISTIDTPSQKPRAKSDTSFLNILLNENIPAPIAK